MIGIAKNKETAANIRQQFSIQLAFTVLHSEVFMYHF